MLHVYLRSVVGKQGNQYVEVIVECNDTMIDLGLFDRKEALQLADNLSYTVCRLISMLQKEEKI